MRVIKYLPAYQKQVKDFVISIHEEFGFPYNRKLDYDLENPAKYYEQKGGVFYVLLEKDKVVGTIAVKRQSGKVAELKRLYLHTKLRGKGLGGKLLDKALDFCKEQEFEKVVLDTNKKQLVAQKLYKKNGFVVDRVVKNTIFMSKGL